MDDDNNILGSIYLLNGSLVMKKKLVKSEFFAFRDPITGLYNRRFFEEELKRLNTSRNLPISLAVINIDHLDQIKKELGTIKATSIIKKIARLIKKECRNDDIIVVFERLIF